MRFAKWGDPKVCWKFIDTPQYDRGLELKSSVSVFSVYLSCVERAVACYFPPFDMPHHKYKRGQILCFMPRNLWIRSVIETNYQL